MFFSQYKLVLMHENIKEALYFGKSFLARGWSYIIWNPWCKYRSLSFLQYSTRGPRSLNLAAHVDTADAYEWIVLRRRLSLLLSSKTLQFLLWKTKMYISIFAVTLGDTCSQFLWVKQRERETHSWCCASIWMSCFVSTRKWEESDPSGLPSDIWLSHSVTVWYSYPPISACVL